MHEPSINETAFNCPHCGAYTTQNWNELRVYAITSAPRHPLLPAEDEVKALSEANDLDPQVKASLINYVERIRAGTLFVDLKAKLESGYPIQNLFASQCYNCKKWAVWVNSNIIYPPAKFGALPNQDLPDNVLAVTEEARGIVEASPKGAAALLRLAIQLLCIHLGKSGSDLNAAIGSLVSDGLNPVVQKSLDVVRVIGNESVHPGTIDLNDDRDTAIRLFDLVNIICEQMITQPRQVSELYEKLPEDKRKQIEQRDNGKAGR